MKSLLEALLTTYIEHHDVSMLLEKEERKIDAVSLIWSGQNTEYCYSCPSVFQIFKIMWRVTCDDFGVNGETRNSK
jgi:hypothetical protein